MNSPQEESIPVARDISLKDPSSRSKIATVCASD
jgi:hypothetical protein